MNIFLVEDSAVIRDRLHTLIGGVANATLAAEADNQDDAVDGILAALPDLVILDLHLASGSGMEVLRQIKTRQPAIQVIVLTNYGYPQYRKRCIGLGADYFLDKSRDIGTLEVLLADLASNTYSCNNTRKIGAAREQ